MVAHGRSNDERIQNDSLRGMLAKLLVCVATSGSVLVWGFSVRSQWSL